MTENVHRDKINHALSLQQPPSIPAVFLSTTDSTNRVAAELLNTRTPPFVVVAEHQTAGRGTKRRSFHSPKGGLYASYVFEIPVRRLLQTTPRAAVACAEAIAGFGKDPKIKWVNDLMLDGKKIGGILTESTVRGNHAAVIVGVGLNLYFDQTLPEALQAIAAPVWDEAEQVRAQALFDSLTVWMQRMIEEGAPFTALYENRSCVIGKTIEVCCDGVWTEAAASGIDAFGRLRAQTGAGEILLNTEEIRLKRQI